MDAKAHWEHLYGTNRPTDVSWYQAHADLSLRLIKDTGAQPGDPIVDVGGGASTLVDDLVSAGYQAVTVLDISASALRLARARLGPRAAQVTWIEADVTKVAPPRGSYRVWHDRAVFHFLTAAEDRRRYVEAVRHAVRPGGHVIVATFAVDGPLRCSGLDVVRYSPSSLHDEFGADFDLVRSAEETHHTPFGTDQKFIYCFCRKD